MKFQQKIKTNRLTRYSDFSYCLKHDCISREICVSDNLIKQSRLSKKLNQSLLRNLFYPFSARLHLFMKSWKNKEIYYLLFSALLV